MYVLIAYFDNFIGNGEKSIWWTKLSQERSIGSEIRKRGIGKRFNNENLRCEKNINKWIIQSWRGNEETLRSLEGWKC